MGKIIINDESTLGYQYNWTDRYYNKEKFVEFPKDIGSLVTYFANCCGWKKYNPEAV
jgi:hypothetical protein